MMSFTRQQKQKSTIGNAINIHLYCSWYDQDIFMQKNILIQENYVFSDVVMVQSVLKR